ncbi:MAG: NAD(+)/NADH kinase [Halobacteriaceae archaeon]
MRIGIVAQRGNARAVELAATLINGIEDDVTVAVDPETARALDRPATPVERLSETDLLVSIGGDGTFLFAARHARTTPILGVNLGEVGFLNAVKPSDAVDATRALIEEYEADGSIQSQPIPRLSASGPGWSLGPAVNEILVQAPQRGRGRTITTTVRVGGREYVDRDVDGIIVATPAGSTAYNLSEGGPLLQPTSGCLVVTPMSPAPAARPLVVEDDTEVTVEVTGTSAGVVVADGSRSNAVSGAVTATIGRAGIPAHVAGPGVDLFSALGKLE